MSTKQLHDRFQDVVETANFAALDAADATQVVAMQVGTPKNLMASLMGGDDGGFRDDRPVYHVADGVCGFAWVNLRATGTEGRKFLNWVQGKVKSPHPYKTVAPEQMSEPRKDSYYGGVSLNVFGFGQSLQRKESFAREFAKRLNDSGVEGLTAFVMSRMD